MAAQLHGRRVTEEEALPFLYAIDDLRLQRVVEEKDIHLPTIVLVGDKASGKSSLLRSLAGVPLPSIPTRVPLIVRLRDDLSDDTPLLLEYRDQQVRITTEAYIADAVKSAMEHIAGYDNSISSEPVTLLVRKKGVPNLTIVDLPGIRRLSTDGEPEDICELISTMVMNYIICPQNIIVNVLDATVKDFLNCKSIRMSKLADKSWERTIAVVTMSDLAPEGLLEKVTAGCIKIGLEYSYACVRNWVGEKTCEEARIKEEELFAAQPLLSKIKNTGIPLVAQLLVKMQAINMICCLPGMEKKIDERLSLLVSDLARMPPRELKLVTSNNEAEETLRRIISKAKKSLKKLLILGEYYEFHDDLQMHAAARLMDMLHLYHSKLIATSPDNFLKEEVKELTESKCFGLPNFPTRSAFVTLLRKKLNSIAPADFIADVSMYLETVVVRVLLKHSKDYPHLEASMRWAARRLIETMHSTCSCNVDAHMKMEKFGDYTVNPDYESMWRSLMDQLGVFMDTVDDDSKPATLTLKFFGQVDIAHLRKHKAVAGLAFAMGMRLLAYWRIVIMRLVDWLGQNVFYNMTKLIDNMKSEVQFNVEAYDKKCFETMLSVSEEITRKREWLNNNIHLLKETKSMIADMLR